MQKGILAGIIVKDSLLYLARSVAVKVQVVPYGTDAGSLSNTFAAQEEITINMASAQTIEVFPNCDLFTEAELIEDVTGYTRITRETKEQPSNIFGENWCN